MTVKGGNTESLLTRIHNEQGESMAVKVMASGDIQILTGEVVRGSPLDPTVAYRKMGINFTPQEDGSFTRDQISLGCLPPSHWFRKGAAVLVAHPVFEQIILFLILISSINLALDEPRIMVCQELPSDNPDNCIALAAWLSWSDIIITALFVLEMVAKIVALGFALPKTSYLRNPWNALDFAIVLISVLSLALASLGNKLKALRSLRALRALRPLRVVSRYPGLKLVVNAVIGAIPKVKNVFVINFLFLLLLAIVGLQNFSGAMAYCNDSEVSTKDECTGTFMLTDGSTMAERGTELRQCVELANGYLRGGHW
jgi:hypothetical protein